MNLNLNRPISRRTLLQGAGVTLALPFLESMLRAGQTATVPRRMVAIETNMGIIPQFFFPEKGGRDYVLSPYLQKLAQHREKMTVFSGVSLPGVTGGHAAEKCFLTGTPHPDRGGFRNWVSLDQFAAEHVGVATRHPSMSLAMVSDGSPTLSYTRSGAPIPAEKSPSKLFQKLFVQGKASEVEANVEAVRGDTSNMRHNVDALALVVEQLAGRLDALEGDVAEALRAVASQLGALEQTPGGSPTRMMMSTPQTGRR